MCAQNDRLMRETIFFTWNTSWASQKALRKGQGLRIDYGLQIWTTFQFYVKNLTYFDLKSAQMCAQNFFSLGTHHGRANRPCEGDGVSETPMVAKCGPHFNLGQNFHYNIDIEI